MTSRHEKEPELSALAALWRAGKISTEELSRHLKRRQLPLFPGPEKKYLPLFTPAEQEQLTLFLTAQQRQLSLSLVAEVKDELAGNE
jgi:hypothetical protein